MVHETSVVHDSPRPLDRIRHFDTKICRMFNRTIYCATMPEPVSPVTQRKTGAAAEFLNLVRVPWHPLL